MDKIKILRGTMTFDIELIFCTYFKRIEQFRYEYESYEECVAFCVKSGSFYYQIDDETEKIITEGEIVICPPNRRFGRRILEPAEICMIKFKFTDSFHILGKKIKISNVLRFYEDLRRLENCLFCHRLFEEPFFSHYCMDILYLAIYSMRDNNRISSVKKYIEQNYDKEIYICEVAKQTGYTTPYLINKFKLYYSVTPKAYLLQVRLLKAKELLITTDKLSREIANALGFSDELYFIRFFKKHTGLTPKQFRKYSL